MKLISWAKRNLIGLCIGFVIFCSLLGLWVGITISMSEDAPGAILIFGGIAFIGSSIVSLIWAAMGKMLLDIEKKLK